MGIFDFFKDAGEKLANAVGISDANANEAIQDKIQTYDFGIEGLEATVDGDKVTLNGTAPTAEAAEKAILIAGNIAGVSQVESNLNITEAAPEATFYTVQSGDTLGGIASKFYGNAGRYPEIFEANKPMLSDPDRIYPGQNLRIPGASAQAAA
ncbi:MAG: peptidoglycan-binding protein LysM [Rickettsiales bacterium]|nr:peptidoglycan-binding protein LysM [Rickettsiales bacterium]